MVRKALKVEFESGKSNRDSDVLLLTLTLKASQCTRGEMYQACYIICVINNPEQTEGKLSCEMSQVPHMGAHIIKVLETEEGLRK